LLELLLKIKKYIEETEKTLDGEWGSSRKIEQIILDGDMPDVYTEVLKEIEKEE
jgi:hypothetical protein